MTSVLHRDIEATETPRVEQHKRTWGVFVLFSLLAALIGFGAGWLAFRDSGSEGDAVDVPAEARELVDSYFAARNVADGAAALETMAVGGTYYGPNAPDEGRSGDDLAAIVNSAVSTDAYTDIAYIGVFGEGPYVVLTTSTFELVGDEYPMYSMFNISEEFGELKIDTIMTFSGSLTG